MELKAIKSLADTVPNSINKIEWWLLKYYDHYKISHKAEYEKYRFTNHDGSKVRLPRFEKETNNQKFMELYEKLDELSSFHKFEDYFVKQMLDFNKIGSNITKVQDWLEKNEALGKDKFVCFLMDYFDEEDEENTGYLKISLKLEKAYNIYVDSADFKNTVEFLKTFNELYWTLKIKE